VTLLAAVDVRLGGFHLDVELQVEPGEVLAVLGPNGSGKTTMLRTLAGLVPVDRGSLRLADPEVGDIVLDDPDAGVFVPPEERPVGVVFQQYLLFDHLSAIDNVAFGLRARGVGRAAARRQAAGWLERVGLSAFADARPRALSGGQAQRVALARALAVEPRVLLLDEPLAALDAGTRRQVRRDLRTHLAGFDGVRVLVTHDPIDAYALADRVAIMDSGRVVQCGTVADITAHPRSRYVAELVGTNLVTGDVGPDGLTTADGVVVSVVSDFVGAGFAMVRPQSITLSRSRVDSSARNRFAGTVDEIDRVGDRVRVGVAGPLHLTAEITERALDTLGLQLGDEVYAVVKATDIETYPA
jgi:molybdate transport system ATP-binding protein